MAEVISCRDIGVDCDFVARGDTVEEVLQACAKHGKEAHGMDKIPPELAEKVQGRLSATSSIAVPSLPGRSWGELTQGLLASTLGNSDLRITPIGIGAWAMGGGWGPQDDNASIAAIRKGLECGINWVDTAAVYGLGHSEEVVARALEGVADRPYVFTKCVRN